MESVNKLRGNIVAHGIGVRDLYYGIPDIEGMKYVGHEIEEVNDTYKVQLKFMLKDGKEFNILLMSNNY